MRRKLHRGAMVWMIVALSTPAGAAAQDAGDGLSLERVLLSTGGVGYFEYAATVTGDADLAVDVRLDQVDDVLKSVVVFDDAGTIGQISLPGRTPLVDAFRDLPFEPGDLDQPAALLGALRGAAVRVDGPRSVTGRVLSVTAERRLAGDGAPADRAGGTVHRLALMTDDGLVQVILEDADRIAFEDPAVRARVVEALDALADDGAGERRRLTVSLDGAGAEPRTVRVAYLVEAPLWKTAYRLTLDEAAPERARLQGWAVLENLSGVDWAGVDLAVVSGNPVTFRQALFDAYYVDRPQVPVSVPGRVLPPVDRGGIALPPGRGAAGGAAGGGGEGAAADGLAEPAPVAALSGMARAAESMAAPPPPPGQAQLAAAAADAAATQVLFRAPAPVTLETGHTLLLPIVDRTGPVDRPRLYQPGVDPRHPMATARIVNDGAGALPPGVITLYERDADSGLVRFLGDARIDTLPVGVDRLVAFALDPAVTVDRDERGTRRMAAAAIADGVLRRSIVQRRTTVYTIEGAAERDVTVILEHPRPTGDERLVDTPDRPVEATADALRLTVAVPAGETVVEEVAVERTVAEQIGIAELDLDRLRAFAGGDLPSAIREAFAELAALRAELAALERAVAETDRAIDETIADQGRIRANLDSLDDGGDLAARYRDALAGSEDRLAALRAEREARRTDAAAARDALATAIRELEVRG